MVDPGAVARYNALAFDPAGNPAIAYSDDPDGPDGLPFVGYNGPPVGSATESVRVAWKAAP